MAGRPPEGYASSRNEDLLLDLDDSRPMYSSGQRPPANDDDLLRRYDIDDSETQQPRPSVSYDDFLGGPHGNFGAQGGAGGQAADYLQAPYLSSANRMHSQTSVLHNYQPYADDDDLPDDRSAYYGTGGIDDNSPTLPSEPGKPNNRNSVLSMGGGFMARAKNVLGMRPAYSEMDLPLTEPGAASARTESGETGGLKPPKPKKFDGSSFKFGFGRGKPDPSSLGPRIIHLNNPPANAANKFKNNHVSTTKYNAITFLPKFLYQEFAKVANVFFLFTAILQQIPNISPTNRYTTIIPLAVVLLVAAIKEAVEDQRRRSQDTSLNNSKARVLKGSSFQDVRWINVAVGDIVRVQSEEPFPADLVLLASSEPEGLCYIETANLDGETNLKIKQAIPETANLVSPGELSRLGGKIRSEQPNSSLYTYEATLTMQ
ncbi:hypothetical protein LTS18_014679, partial [Coniosporium uncinatum]